MSSIIRADKWQNALGVAYNSVLQVVSTTKTDTFSTTATSFTDITGLSVTITPKFSSSKILILVDAKFGISGDFAGHMRLLRDSTAIYVSDAAGSRTPSTAGNVAVSYAALMFQSSPIYLDSPNTTSATTYKVQAFTNSGTVYLNRTGLDRDTAAYDNRSVSSITVMEIAQ